MRSRPWGARQAQSLHLGLHLVQVWAFCLAIPALLYLIAPHFDPAQSLVYSLCIGTCTWAVIDLGRLAVSEPAGTGWPSGWGGPALTMAGIVLGYVGGVALGDLWLGLNSWRGLDWRAHGGAMAITLVAGLVISGYFYLRGKSAHLQKRMQQAQAQATEARLRLLTSQLEPHMLFNTLANLRVLVALEPSRAQQMLDHLIAYLRATLGASQATEHTLEAEFERLHDYLELMSVRMGARLRYRLELPADLREAAVPTLLLQPLVENSIRHGLEPCPEGGEITVSARLQHPTPGTAFLQLQVADTGQGLAPDSQQAQPGVSGFGLRQLRERLHTLHGASASLSLAPLAPHGLLATVRLPLLPLTQDHPSRLGA